MLGRAIWDKLSKRIFENFENAQIKQGQFQNFQKSQGQFIPKIAWTKHVIAGFKKDASQKTYQPPLIFENFEITLNLSGQFQSFQKYTRTNCFKSLS